MSVKDQILKKAEELKATYLFLGYHGRKGPKKDPTIMGTTIKFMTFESHIPTFVVNF